MNSFIKHTRIVGLLFFIASFNLLAASIPYWAIEKYDINQDRSEIEYDIMSALVSPEDAEIGIAAAKAFREINVDQLIQYTKNEYYLVRLAIAHNPAATARVLQILSHDPVDMVRKVAESRVSSSDKAQLASAQDRVYKTLGFHNKDQEYIWTYSPLAERHHDPLPMALANLNYQIHSELKNVQQSSQLDTKKQIQKLKSEPIKRGEFETKAAFGKRKKEHEERVSKEIKALQEASTESPQEGNSYTSLFATHFPKAIGNPVLSRIQYNPDLQKFDIVVSASTRGNIAGQCTLAMDLETAKRTKPLLIEAIPYILIQIKKHDLVIRKLALESDNKVYACDINKTYANVVGKKAGRYKLNKTPISLTQNVWKSLSGEWTCDADSENFKPMVDTLNVTPISNTNYSFVHTSDKESFSGQYEFQNSQEDYLIKPEKVVFYSDLGLPSKIIKWSYGRIFLSTNDALLTRQYLNGVERDISCIKNP